MRLILASTSPRRREILALLGVSFKVIAPDFDEIASPSRTIEEEVLAFADGKAQSVAHAYPGSIVIGSDTMIGLGGSKIGKARGAEEVSKAEVPNKAAAASKAVAVKAAMVVNKVAVIRRKTRTRQSCSLHFPTIRWNWRPFCLSFSTM